MRLAPMQAEIKALHGGLNWIAAAQARAGDFDPQQFVISKIIVQEGYIQMLLSVADEEIKLKRTKNALERLDEALGLINDIKLATHRDPLLKEAAILLAKAHALPLAFDAADRISTERPEALVSLIKALFEQDDMPRALEVFDRLKALCRNHVIRLTCGSAYHSALGEIGYKQAAMGDKEGVARTLQAATAAGSDEASMSWYFAGGYIERSDHQLAARLIDQISRDPSANSLRERLALSLAKKGDIATALKIVSGITKPDPAKDPYGIYTVDKAYLVDSLYESVADVQRDAGDFAAAEKTASNIVHEKRRWRVAVSIRLAKGEFGPVLEQIRSTLTDAAFQVYSLEDVAFAQRKAGDAESARATLAAALDAAKTIQDAEKRASTLANIGAEQLAAKNSADAKATFAQALAATERIADQGIQGKSTREILAIQVKGNDVEGAKASFRLAVSSAKAIQTRAERVKALALTASIVAAGNSSPAEL